MAIIIRVNGNASGEGFLLAPDGARTFPVPVGLRTDDGTTVAATLQQAAGGVPLVFSSTSVNITPTETFVEVHATAASGARNDTVLQVAVGAVVQASFDLTAITQPQVWFQGRFQARFATFNDVYNEPRGTDLGWTFALIGEPDFCPAGAAGVPDTIDKAVGRQIRFHNPVALRSHVAPIGVVVNEVKAMVGALEESWTAGDSVFGMPVNLGPDSYFAENRPRKLTDPPPAESYADGKGPIANFELHIGGVFSGRSATPADRPKADGAFGLSPDELAQYGIGDLTTFRNTRRTQLISDFNALSAADESGAPGQNLTKRIAHLGGDPGLGISPKPGTANAVWTGKETVAGRVYAGVDFGPSDSAVLAYMAGYNEFSFGCMFFNFHSDELCGQVHGSVAVDTSSAIPPLQPGVFNVDSRQAGGFAALTVDGLTPAAVGAILGAGPMVERVVVTVSGDYDRLVVSRAAIANPGAPPASWTIASRTDSLVGQFLPEASVFPRELAYLILPPGHQENVLGSCEGAAFAPPPAVGFARLYAEGTAWKLLLHAGTNGGTGITYRGEWVSPATVPAGCTPLDVEVLTPSINFGSVEQGLTMYREIVLLNRSAAAVTITLSLLPPPFGAPSATSVVIAPGSAETLLVSFTAGVPGTSGPTPITLGSNPVAATTLQVTLTGTSVAATTADIVLVLDRSGSMSEPAMTSPRPISKSDLRNEAAQVLVELLRDGDRIGMVRFNHDAQPHMPLTAAGPDGGGTGKADAVEFLDSADLAPSGATSVGDGMSQGNAMLTAAPSSAAQRGLVVLTDGVENDPLYISDVALAAGVRAYAIGFGLPQNVNVDKLSAVTGNTGGYLLVTGELDTADTFRLHKYFAQVLAGITADQIVVDPQSDIAPGETQRIPFYISEADVRFDAVLLTHFPMLRFALEAPDGTRIDAASAGGFNGRLVEGRACRYYRMQLPTFPGDPDRAYGRWHMVVEYPGPKRYQGAAAIRARIEGAEAQLATAAFEGQYGWKRRPVHVEQGRRYSVLVKARSAVQIEGSVQQRGFGPAAERLVVAYARAFGLPMTSGVDLMAQVTRPDGVTRFIPLTHGGHGRYEAVLDDARQYGNYQVVVRAAGHSPAGFPLQRELTLTAPVIDPTAKSEADVRTAEIARQLEEAREAQQALLDSLRQWLARTGAGAAAQRLPWWLHWAVALFILLLLIILLLMVVRT